MTYFDKPTQVRVEDPDGVEGSWIYGIAYKDEMICACCGSVFELDEFNEDGLAIEILGDWVDFGEYIR